MPMLDWPSGLSVHGVPTRLNRHRCSPLSKSASYFFAQSRIAATSLIVGLRLWAWPATVAGPSRRSDRQAASARRRAADLAIVVLSISENSCRFLPPFSTLGRQHLTADLAVRVSLGVHV